MSEIPLQTETDVGIVRREGATRQDMGTSLIRKRFLLGPCSSMPMPGCG